MIVEPRFRFRGSDVADLLDRWVAAHGAPETITVDHGTEFTSKALETWAWKRGERQFQGEDFFTHNTGLSSSCHAQA